MPHQRRGLILRGPLQIAAFMGVMGFFCVISGGTALIVGLVLWVLGVGVVYQAKEKGEL